MKEMRGCGNKGTCVFLAAELCATGRGAPASAAALAARSSAAAPSPSPLPAKPNASAPGSESSAAASARPSASDGPRLLNANMRKAPHTTRIDENAMGIGRGLR